MSALTDTLLTTVVRMTTDPSFEEFNKQQDQMFEEFNRQQDRAQTFFGLSVAFLLVFGVVALAYTVFWIWTLIDAATTPDAAWDTVGQNKLVWLVVMFFFGVASIVYLFWPRPQLKQAASAVSAPATYAAA